MGRHAISADSFNLSMKLFCSILSFCACHLWLGPYLIIILFVQFDIFPPNSNHLQILHTQTQTHRNDHRMLPCCVIHCLKIHLRVVQNSVFLSKTIHVSHSLVTFTMTKTSIFARFERKSFCFHKSIQRKLTEMVVI